MTSIVSICNQAILEAGGKSITSLNDPSVEAKLCNTIYEDARDFVTEAREWTFAVGRRTLAKDATPPDWGYANRFKLPSDTLRALEVFDRGRAASGAGYAVGREENSLHWQREGEYVMADAEIVDIRYLQRVDDPNRFSAGYVQALVMYMASQLAIPIQSSKSLRDTNYALYENKLATAAATEGMQGRTRPIRSSNLTRVRGR